eukprot:GHVN01051330.1.p1 GENE.GHVN01051330.1~~GHVN01051330.1.p1  ORF type:complete len:703 (+),score=117.01 GHVN01051330.1:306-2414(+)
MSGSNMTEADLVEVLAKLSIDSKIHRHEAVNTIDVMKETLSHLPAALVKNLFVKDKKDRFILISALADTRIDMKDIAKKLKSTNPRMTDAELLLTKLGVRQGCVTPLAILNDKTNEVELVMDERIKSVDKVVVHPFHNEASVEMKVSDLVKVIEEHGKKTITWLDFSIDAAISELSPVKPAPPVKADKVTVAASATDSSALGITVKKDDDFSQWYTQVIKKACMIDYYDVSGCYVLRPWSYYIWESLQRFFDPLIKNLGVDNCYFPMFVQESNLKAEENHVQGFSPEVAWVTMYGDKKLNVPVAIRPTSETIMYPTFKRWIRSHRDLPLKINQWSNVVRWEFKQPTPFIRTREFLWQEGHTAHCSDDEAWEFTQKINSLYVKLYRDMLAVPVVAGVKSENEKFAGAKLTTSVEAFVPNNGRAIQAATSHHLGTNFAKMFDVTYLDDNKTHQLVHQTSWAYSTRAIGTMVMIHGDDRGLVLPPHVASIQAVVVPIFYKDSVQDTILNEAKLIYEDIKASGIRAHLDDRLYNPGWKFNDWEVKGVCVRIELGPNDFENHTLRVVRRDTMDAETIKRGDVVNRVNSLLDEIHHSMYDKALAKLKESIVPLNTWEGFIDALNSKKAVMAPWCESVKCEEAIKYDTAGQGDEQCGEDGGAALTGAAKSLCIPFDQGDTPLPVNTKCFRSIQGCTGTAHRKCLFGRSY